MTGATSDMSVAGPRSRTCGTGSWKKPWQEGFLGREAERKDTFHEIEGDDLEKEAERASPE